MKRRSFLLATAGAGTLRQARAVTATATKTGAPPLNAPQRASYAVAVQLFREHRYPGAYGRFMALADAGHGPSARIALLMVDTGPELFGHDWSATRDQRRRWRALALAECSGRDSANAVNAE